MGTEAIVARILADADAEAQAIVAAAEERRRFAVAEAEAHARAEQEETEAEVKERARRLTEGKEAAARLDAAKILLAEKRRVLDEIYSRALEKLLALSRHDSLELFTRLLERYAEEGDEIVFSRDFAFAAEAARLPIVKERGLTVSKERAGTGGGCILRGRSCDKDLTYVALLAADREENLPAIARKLFPAERDPV